MSGSVIDTGHVLDQEQPMHNTERIMIQEQLSELFDLADELRRRIDELAEMVANPPAQAQVLQLHRRATFDMDHLPKLGLHQNPE